MCGMAHVVGSGESYGYDTKGFMCLMNNLNANEMTYEMYASGMNLLPR